MSHHTDSVGGEPGDCVRGRPVQGGGGQEHVLLCGHKRTARGPVHPDRRSVHMATGGVWTCRLVCFTLVIFCLPLQCSGDKTLFRSALVSAFRLRRGGGSSQRAYSVLYNMSPSFLDFCLQSGSVLSNEICLPHLAICHLYVSLASTLILCNLHKAMGHLNLNVSPCVSVLPLINGFSTCQCVTPTH